MRWVVAAAAALALCVPVSAQAEDPVFVNWASVLPSVSGGFDPDSDNICVSGKDQCVHAVIKEMERRFKPLADRCDHDAPFSLAYLRTTEEYHRFWHEPGSFDDEAWLNHYDAVFGAYYFVAQDHWKAGRLSDVPQAWKIAFEASRNRTVSGSGSLFLGMSAHINRDLPFVLYEIGLSAPDGTSRKFDHDRVNRFLNRVSDGLLPELAQRFDPTIDDNQLDGTPDDFASFQLIPGWRENAWRNAEALANAPTSAARALVAQKIESEAAAAAKALAAVTSYGLLNNSAARDAWCAAHHWDA